MNKGLANIIYYVLLIAALLLGMWRWYLRSNGREEEADMLRNIIIVLIAAALLFRLGQKLFPKWFRGRPTREELDEK